MRVTQSSMKISNRIVVALLATFLIIVNATGLIDPIQAVVQQLAFPVRQQFVSWVQPSQLPFEEIFSIVEKSRRIKELELELAVNLNKVTELETIKKENDQLRALLDQQIAEGANLYIARPILSLSYPAVMGGSMDGVSEGSVVTLNQILLGRIGEVSARQSRVELLYQKSSKPILAVTESGEQGIVVGDGKRVLLKELPKRSPVNKGQRVVTVGQEGVPSQLLIGTIGSVDQNPSSPSQTATIVQPVEFYDSVLVEVWQR